MKKTGLVLVLVLGCALALSVAACGTGSTTTTIAPPPQPSIAPTTTTTEGPPTWTKIEPVGEVPSARCRHSMVYDPGIGKVILFGGGGDDGRLSDTWAYDPVANTWANLNPKGDVPAGSLSCSLVYDPGSGKVILFKGQGSESNGPWAYDSTANTWTKVNPTGDAPPSPNSCPVVYDPTSGKMILFGGQGDQSYLEDTWAYDPAANTWSELEPSGDLPPGRWMYGMVYDSASARMILFGGRGNRGDISDTWAYGSAANTWTNLNPTGANPYGPYPSAIYDPASGKVVVFKGGTIDFNDTWTYDPVANTWTKSHPAGVTPPTRAWASLVYDPTTDRVILFGGGVLVVGGPEIDHYLNDMWAYSVNP